MLPETPAQTHTTSWWRAKLNCLVCCCFFLHFSFSFNSVVEMSTVAQRIHTHRRTNTRKRLILVECMHICIWYVYVLWMHYIWEIAGWIWFLVLFFCFLVCFTLLKIQYIHQSIHTHTHKQHNAIQFTIQNEHIERRII